MPELMLEWYFLIFELPFLAALGYLLLQAITGVMPEHGIDADHDVGAGHDLDHDVGVDHDLGVDHDVGVDHDLHVDHGVDVDHDHDHGLDHDADHEPSPTMRALSLLGVGRIPVSLIAMSFCFIWGFVGFGSNMVLKDMLITPILYAPISIGLALVLAICLTSLGAKWLAKITPTTETYVSTPKQRVGLTGTVIHTVTKTTGTVRVWDQHRALLDLAAITNQRETISPGTKVVIVSHNSDTDRYTVVPDTLE